MIALEWIGSWQVRRGLRGNSRPHTINIIVKIRRFDNIIDRVRSCIDVLTEILTVFRKTGNRFINTRCIEYKCQFNMSAEQNLKI